MDTFQDNIENAIEEKLPKAGGTLSGNIVPDATNLRDLGSSDKQFSMVYLNKMRFNNGNSFSLNWAATGDLMIGIDSETRSIPTMNGHAIKLTWDNNGLGVYIDNTFVGYVTLHQ